MSNTTQTQRTSAKALVELNDKDLRSIVPAVFATEAHPDVSDKYTFVPTTSVLPILRDSGFVVTSASKPKNGDIHSRHRLELFHRDSLDDLRAGRIEECPRVILENSHNRSRRLVMMAGYYRFICSNGLIVASGAGGELKALHIKLDVAGVKTLIGDLAKMLDSTRQSVEIFRDRKLTKIEQSTFAHFALETRYRGYGYGDSFPIEAKDLLAVRRDADTADDLWTVFNRVQENLMRGGIRTTTGRKSQGLSSFGVQVDVNKRLWAGAEAIATGGTRALQQLRKAIAKN